MTSDTSRRDLLKTLGAAGAGAMLSLGSLAAQDAKKSAIKGPGRIDVHHQYSFSMDGTYPNTKATWTPQASLEQMDKHFFGSGADQAAALRAGQTVVWAGGEDGILSVSGGLIHHWHARILLPHVSLEDVVAVSRSYTDYPDIFGPIVAARVLSDTGENLVVQFRMKESAGGMSATLDMRSRIRYVRVDRRRVYSTAASEEIVEIKDPGGPGERRLAPGHDSGYLWRASSFSRFVEDDGGVYMDMETVGLSRQFPPLLGWFIEPIARRIGRRSVENSVNEFKRAVLARMAR